MKSPEMKKALERIGEKVFGRSRKRCLEEQTCVVCGYAASEFRDEASAKEYSISRMCQPCQDFTFGRN